MKTKYPPVWFNLQLEHATGHLDGNHYQKSQNGYHGSAVKGRDLQWKLNTPWGSSLNMLLSIYDKSHYQKLQKLLPQLFH